jgi:hypothetical protein
MEKGRTEMKRLISLMALGLVFSLCLGIQSAYSQAAFKIPFKFTAEGKSYPPGEYWIAQQEDGKITLRNQAKGEDVRIPIIEKLKPSEPPLEAPQLIFDMVGNFEPSYTEYVTVYLLAEVWLTGKDGYLVLDMERAEDKKGITGVITKK